MMKKHTVNSLLRIGLLSLLVIAISGCLLATKQPELQDVPEDALMSVFFLGCWKSTNAYGSEGQEISYRYEVLVDEDTLDFVLIDSKGYFLTNTKSEYWFIDVNEIFFDNQRNAGESWLLERDDQDLIVYRTSNNSTITIIFTRDVCR